MSERSIHPIDWLRATEEDRARLYRVAKAVMDMTGTDPQAFYLEAIGRSVDVISTNGNFSRGKIARRHAAMIYSWIEANHFDIALRVAPEMFRRSARSGWQALLQERAQYDAVSIVRFSGFGVVQPASKFPIESRPIRLGEAFAFKLSSRQRGRIFAFQESRGLWHLVPLGETDSSFVRTCQQSDQIFPSQDDGSPIPIVETESDGLHSFVFVVVSDGSEIAVSELKGLALRPEQLNGLSDDIRAKESNLRAIYRINVRFVR